jgi:hypothetical protein
MPAGRSRSQRAVANAVATTPTCCAWLLSRRAVIHLDVQEGSDCGGRLLFHQPMTWTWIPEYSSDDEARRHRHLRCAEIGSISGARGPAAIPSPCGLNDIDGSINAKHTARARGWGLHLQTRRPGRSLIHACRAPEEPSPSERQPAHREGISEADAEGPLTGAAARPGHDG